MDTRDLVKLFQQYCKEKNNEWLGLVIHEDGSVTVDELDINYIGDTEDFSSLEKAIEHMQEVIGNA